MKEKVLSTEAAAGETSDVPVEVKAFSFAPICGLESPITKKKNALRSKVSWRFRRKTILVSSDFPTF